MRELFWFPCIAVITLLMFQACGEKKRSEEELAYIAEVNHRRIALDDFFRKNERSPLPDSIRSNFKGLSYYPVDPACRVKVTYKSLPDEAPFDMPYTQGGIFEFVKAGEITFSLNGNQHTLNVYKDLLESETPEYQGKLVIPFYDLTNKTETYPGGRFLDFYDPGTNEVILDFNLAFNPWCVYNPSYNCPIPPPENMVNAEIKAGEKISAGN